MYIVYHYLFYYFSPITRPENDLLRLVYDTQSTLMGAAHALHSQGQQLSNASRMMNNLNVDLAVADRITKDLDSYFGAWRCKKQFVAPKSKIEERHGSPLDKDRIEYKVLIGKFVQNTHTDGYLIIGKNAVELLDEKSNILYTFKAGQISNLNVHSPWDMTLIQSYIGRPDVKVHLISTQMPVILRLLENFTRCKANLDDVPEGTAFVDDITSFDEVDGREISKNDSKSYLTHFSPMLHFFTPLKTSKNLWFYDFFRWYRNRTFDLNELI